MFTLEVLYAAGVCICIVICAYLWRMRTFYVASFRMRGPVAWPIVGNVFQFLGSMEGKLSFQCGCICLYVVDYTCIFGVNIYIIFNKIAFIKIRIDNSKVSSYNYLFIVNLEKVCH